MDDSIPADERLDETDDDLADELDETDDDGVDDDDDADIDDELDETDDEDEDVDQDEDVDDEEADEDEDVDDEEADEDETEDEAEFATVASGTTVEEAKRRALEQLRKVVPYVQEGDVEFVTLDEGGHGGFLGMGKSHPRVEARVVPGGGAPAPAAVPAPEAVARLSEFVARVADGVGLDVDVEVTQQGEALVAEIVGDDLGILIGRHGQTLDAVQYLAAIVVNGHNRTRRQVVVDAEGYRGRREVSLKGVADRAVQKVERTHHAVELKPMTAAERKIVHLHLKDHPRIETHSEGDEPQRAVVIAPRR